MSKTYRQFQDTDPLLPAMIDKSVTIFRFTWPTLKLSGIPFINIINLQWRHSIVSPAGMGMQKSEIRRKKAGVQGLQVFSSNLHDSRDQYFAPQIHRSAENSHPYTRFSLYQENLYRLIRGHSPRNLTDFLQNCPHPEEFLRNSPWLWIITCFKGWYNFVLLSLNVIIIYHNNENFQYLVPIPQRFWTCDMLVSSMAVLSTRLQRIAGQNGILRW